MNCSKSKCKHIKNTAKDMEFFRLRLNLDKCEECVKEEFNSISEKTYSSICLNYAIRYNQSFCKTINIIKK